jgi:hypothetical protein
MMRNAARRAADHGIPQVPRQLAERLLQVARALAHRHLAQPARIQHIHFGQATTVTSEGRALRAGLFGVPEPTDG